MKENCCGEKFIGEQPKGELKESIWWKDGGLPESEHPRGVCLGREEGGSSPMT